MLTIAWDVDDVLNELMRTWLDNWWKPRHPDCGIAYADIRSNPPHGLLGVALEEYLHSLDAFRLSGDFQKMPPNAQAKEWFEQHGDSYRHIALTAVPRLAASVSAEWVVRHFGDWIRGFHFVPSPRAHDKVTTYESSKAAVLKRLGNIDIFIDDHEQHVHAVKSLGIRCLLVSQPWNSGKTTLAKILAALTGQRPSGQE